MEQLRGEMARTSAIRDVRGRGLMVGVDLADHDTAVAVEQECFRRGLLILTCGESAVRLVPPLTVTDAEARQAVDILTSAIHAVA